MTTMTTEQTARACEGLIEAPTDGQFEAHLRTGGSWVVTAPRFYAHAATLPKLQGIRDALYGEATVVPDVRWLTIDSTGRPVPPPLGAVGRTT